MIHFILINVLKIVIVEQAIYNQLLITQIHKPYKNHIKTFQFGFQDSFQVKNGPVELLSESYEWFKLINVFKTDLTNSIQ